jgi:competence protein ComGF
VDITINMRWNEILLQVAAILLLLLLYLKNLGQQRSVIKSGLFLIQMFIETSQGPFWRPSFVPTKVSELPIMTISIITNI